MTTNKRIYFADVVLEILGDDFGMVWHVHNCGDTCTFQLITEMKNASATTVSDFVTRFNNVTGCTWRIGKTGVNNLFSRSVVYQCVHRAPTHAGVEFKVGERYMKRGDDSIEYICVRKNLVNNVIYMFNKKTELIECVEPCDDYFNIGSNKKSFGCKATLKVHRVITRHAIIEINWNHNHNMESFSSCSRRDPSHVVKDWFASEYQKGVPPMKALRLYVDKLATTSTSLNYVRLLADRFVY